MDAVTPRISLNSSRLMHMHTYVNFLWFTAARERTTRIHIVTSSTVHKPEYILDTRQTQVPGGTFERDIILTDRVESHSEK